MTTNAPRRTMLRAAAVLAGFAIFSTALLAGMYAATRERIAAAEARERHAALAALLPEGGYDNDPVTDVITVVAPEALGSADPQTVHRARRGGVPIALVVGAVAPDGYAGPIRLLVGVTMDGTVSGVRVVAHQETPGLGDWIEASKSDWAHAFEGRSLADPRRDRWTVRKNGGEFDQFAGATITPRAVVVAVAKTLAYVRDHRDTLFAAGTPR